MNTTKNWSVNSSLLLTGEATPFPAELIHKDRMWEHLLKTSEHDATAQIMLQFVFTVWAKQLRSMVSSHLEGGEYSEITPQVIQDTASVRKHNKFAESVFAVLDRLLRIRPNATTLTQEAYVMFAFNKTAVWLDEKSPDERNRLLNEVTGTGRRLREKFQERCSEIRSQRIEKLRSTEEAVARRKLRVAKEKEDLTNKICYWGLWQSPEAVSAQLLNVAKVSEKKDALKTQLQFRKKVLCQKYPDRCVFQLKRGCRG
jgi:hypothetical protein